MVRLIGFCLLAAVMTMLLRQMNPGMAALLCVAFGAMTLLMLLPAGKQETEAADTAGEEMSFSLEETERRMAEVLSAMDGVGRVQVMLTLKNGPELELAEDADDTDRDGELRRQREPVTLNRGSGYQDVVVTRETYPVYLGAVVVCQGAGSGGVRLAVTEAVAALTGLSADRITVAKSQ